MTPADFVRKALTTIGVISDGETPSASQMADGLSSLKAMISSWSVEGLLIYQVVREAFPLIANQQSYDVGPNGDFDTQKPLELYRCAVQLSSGQELPVSILTLDRWANISSKDQKANYPTQAFPNNGAAFLNLSVWPIPDQVSNLVLYSGKKISNISNANTQLELPDGYDLAIQFNLAFLLATEYGRAMSPEAVKIAADSKAIIKRVNIRNTKSIEMISDAAGLSSRRRCYDIYSGE